MYDICDLIFAALLVALLAFCAYGIVGGFL